MNQEYDLVPENIMRLNIPMLMHLFEQGSTQAFYVDEGIQGGSKPIAAFVDGEHLAIVFDRPVPRTALVTIVNPECEEI